MDVCHRSHQGLLKIWFEFACRFPCFFSFFVRFLKMKTAVLIESRTLTQQEHTTFNYYCNHNNGTSTRPQRYHQTRFKRFQCCSRCCWCMLPMDHPGRVCTTKLPRTKRNSQLQEDNMHTCTLPCETQRSTYCNASDRVHGALLYYEEGGDKERSNQWVVEGVGFVALPW